MSNTPKSAMARLRIKRLPTIFKFLFFDVTTHTRTFPTVPIRETIICSTSMMILAVSYCRGKCVIREEFVEFPRIGVAELVPFNSIATLDSHFSCQSFNASPDIYVSTNAVLFASFLSELI